MIKKPLPRFSFFMRIFHRPKKHLLVLALLLSNFVSAREFTLVLDPCVSTDAKISEETSAFAAELKHQLLIHIPSLRVALSRSHEERLQQQDIASFANRLQADLFIHLNISLEKDAARSVDFYSFAYDPVTDFWATKTPTLAFLPTHLIHLDHAKQSRKSMNNLASLIKASSTCSLNINSILSLPYKPLKGLNCPAFALELTVNNVRGWRTVLTELLPSFVTLITQELSYES